MEEEKMEGRLYHDDLKSEYDPKGTIKIKLEAKKGETENLKGLLRLLKIRNEITDENIIEQNGNLVVELTAGKVKKVEFLTKEYDETKIDNEVKVKVNVEKLKPKTFQFCLIAEQPEISKDKLEELIESINLLGKTSDLQETFSKSGDKFYKISFVLDTDKYGANFIDAVKEMIEDTKFLFAYERIMKNLKEGDRYLGKWERGDFFVKSRVAKDMKEMYEVLEKEYGIFMEEVLHPVKKYGGIPAARAAISCILHNKYNNRDIRLSSQNIADILGGKNHATVLLAINKCKKVKLTQNDLNNFLKVFEKIFAKYEGRKPEKIKSRKI